MPRDSNGNYSLPPVYLAVTGQTVLAEQHNTPLTDIASALTGSLARNGTASMLGNLPMGGHRVTNLGVGVADSDASTLGQARSSGVPIGTVIDFAGPQAPTGFLLCYGQAISRSDYPDLFAAIGTAYGNGNGTTTFNLPDIRGRVSAGKDDMGGTAAFRLTTAQGGVAGNTLAAVGGGQTQTLTIAQMPEHNHGGNTGNAGALSKDVTLPISTGQGAGTALIAGPQATTFSYPQSPIPNHLHAIPSQGGGAAHPNVQPTIIFNKIIKAFTP